MWFEWKYAYFAGWWNSLQHAILLDTAGPNALVRMGNPASYGWLGWGGPEVSLPELSALLLRTSGLAGSDGAGAPELLDFSLLTDEMDIVAAERRALGSALTHWPIYGVTPSAFKAACERHAVDDCPGSMQLDGLDKGSVRTLAESFADWDADHLDARVEALRAQLLGSQASAAEGGDGRPGRPPPPPRILFFHCSCGCDRTGEVAASYSMKYLNKSFTEAMAENERIAGRNIVYKNQVAVQWYCESLRARGLYHRDDCGNCAPFRCHDTGSPVKAALLRRALTVSPVPLLVLALCCWRCGGRRARRGKTADDSDYQRLPAPR